jgi:hypothetical protein
MYVIVEAAGKPSNYKLKACANRGGLDRQRRRVLGNVSSLPGHSDQTDFFNITTRIRSFS